MDDFHRCVYPLYSEASNFTSNLNIIETNTNFQVKKIIGEDDISDKGHNE